MKNVMNVWKKMFRYKTTRGAEEMTYIKKKKNAEAEIQTENGRKIMWVSKMNAVGESILNRKKR